MRSGDDMMWLRGASITTGLALVAAATWSVIEAKALSGAQMWLQVALACGVCVGSMVVGRD